MLDDQLNIQIKLGIVNAKVVEMLSNMSAEGRQKYIGMLDNLLYHIADVEKGHINVADESSEGSVLRIRGRFYVEASGDLLLPSKEEFQAGIEGIGRRNPSLSELTSFVVEAVFSEKNFNFLGHPVKSPNHSLQEEEVYVKFGSKEQASFVLGLDMGFNLDIYTNSPHRTSSNFRFTLPGSNKTTRAVYRTIGALIKCLKEVDTELKKLGAVPGKGGIPIIPDQFVQTEEFNETVKAFQENMETADKQCGLTFARIGKEDLHGFLVNKRNVNRKKRQAALDALVDERINILMKLCSYDLDEFPFNFQREFM